MQLIWAQICFEQARFIMRAPDNRLIDFAELFCLLSSDFRSLINIDESEFVSFAQIAKLYRQEKSGICILSFTAVFWKRIKGQAVFSENEAVYYATAFVGSKALKLVQDYGEDEEIDDRVTYFDDIKQALKGYLFADTDDFISAVMDGVSYTDMEAKVVGPRKGKLKLELDGFEITGIATFSVEISYDHKYDSLLNIQDIPPYTISEDSLLIAP